MASQRPRGSTSYGSLALSASQAKLPTCAFGRHPQTTSKPGPPPAHHPPSARASHPPGPTLPCLGHRLEQHRCCVVGRTRLGLPAVSLAPAQLAPSRVPMMEVTRVRSDASSRVGTAQFEILCADSETLAMKSSCQTPYNSQDRPHNKICPCQRVS